MPDEPQDNGQPEPEPSGNGQPTPPWGSADDCDPEKAWRLITNIRGDLDRVKAERDTFKQKVTAAEDATKTEQQRLEDRAAAAEKASTDASQSAARLRVALRKGLTETQAKRLVGGSEEELEADADELLASFGSGDGEKPSDRRPREALKAGATNEDDDTSVDGDKLAEQILARNRI